MTIDEVPSTEELEQYRQQARSWLAANMPTVDEGLPYHEQDNARLKELMRRLHGGGYSGICFPVELGGAGLSRFHHKVFCAEADGYELPWFASNPGLGIIAPPILEFGNDEQKEHIRAMLEGREVFVQLMSEPSGGSDMAGALTRADRDGDSWVLNGSKVWSSGAWRADWGLILVRTNWDVPKHQGLSMFLLDLCLPGIEVRKIRMSDGSEEFCEEFFQDVLVPDACLLGKADDGWTVAQRLLFHERNSVGGGSPFVLPWRRRGEQASAGDALVDLVRRRGIDDDPRALELLGEAQANDVVAGQLVARVLDATRSGLLPSIASALLRLNAGETGVRRSTIAFELAGADAAAWDGPALREIANRFVTRQSSCIGGGTTEMQRNLISERLLGMPRESVADRDKPFREVRH